MNERHEIWKDIPGYEGLYQISSLGRVMSLRRGKMLKLWRCHGYLNAPLNKDGKQVDARVHRLVATAFIQNPENYSCVDHINGRRDDNRIENLRWCTIKQNNGYDLARMRRSESKKGDKNPFFGVYGANHCSSKKVEQLSLTGTPLKVWASAADACRELGIQFSNISRCCHGRAKSAGGFSWRFLNV